MQHCCMDKSAQFWGSSTGSFLTLWQIYATFSNITFTPYSFVMFLSWFRAQIWRRGIFWGPLKDPDILQQVHRNSGELARHRKGKKSCGSIFRPTSEGRVKHVSIRAACSKSIEGRGVDCATSHNSGYEFGPYKPQVSFLAGIFFLEVDKKI